MRQNPQIIREPVPWDGSSQRTPSTRFNRVKSLAQTAAEADRACTSEARAADRDGDVDPLVLYDDLYAKYVAPVRVPIARNPRGARSVLAAAKFCEENELSFPLYVAANMDALGKWSRSFVPRGRTKPIGFQPTMLLGEKAAARYNQYLRRVARTYHRTDERAIESPQKRLRERLYEGELLVGTYYAASALAGEDVSWDEAASEARPPVEWLALDNSRARREPSLRKVAADLAGSFDQEWTRMLQRACRLRAAATVADQYRAGLSERIGLVREFSWAAFTPVLVRVLGNVRRAPAIPKPSVPDALAWGNWS